jgi:hypothetical protein
MIATIKRLSWLTVVEMVILVSLLITERSNHRLILQNREIIISGTGRNEKLLLDFMMRTVDRWDELQRKNPEITVPKAVEPNAKPHLSEKEMQRP